MKHSIFVKNKSKEQGCLETKDLMSGLTSCSDLVPKGCHNGACGVCKIRVISGEYETKKMNRKHISNEEEVNNILLACRVYPRSDMEIEFLPKSKLNEKPKPQVYVFGS